MPLPKSLDGLQQPYSRGTATPTQSPIQCRYWDLHFHMLDIPPWGIILPVETGDTGPVGFYLEIRSLGLPAGTVLGMRWTPRGGSGTHRVTETLTGNETTHSYLRLEDAWLLDAEGQSVLIEHEIALPDGSVTVGTPVTVQVPHRVAFGTMTIDGLDEGSLLDPSDFPNGIAVHYTPIGNIRDYHNVSFTWIALGIRGPVNFPLSVTYYGSAGKPGEDYHFLVPPECYTGLEDPSFDLIIFRAIPEVKLVPAPAQHFYYGYGAKTMHLLQNTKGK